MDSEITFSIYEPISKYFNNKYLIGLTFVTILLIGTVVYYNPNINYLIIPSTFVSKDVSSTILTFNLENSIIKIVIFLVTLAHKI